jgi:hypothetical protein
MTTLTSRNPSRINVNHFHIGEVVMHVSNRAHPYVATKPVVADIPFTPTSSLKFAGQDIKKGASIEKLISALRAKGVEVTLTKETGHGYVNYVAKSGNQTLRLGGGGTEDSPGGVMGFSIKTGDVTRTVTHKLVTISRPAQLPRAYDNVFKEGLPVDLGDRKGVIKLGVDIRELAKSLGLGHSLGRSEGGGYEFHTEGSGKARPTQLTVFADEEGKVHTVWADAKSFPRGVVPFERSVALTNRNEGGKATLTLGESTSLIKNGIVKSTTTFNEGAASGVNRLSRSGL